MHVVAVQRVGGRGWDRHVFFDRLEASEFARLAREDGRTVRQFVI